MNSPRHRSSAARLLRLASSLACALSLTLASSAARADNPTDAANEKLAAQTAKAGKSPAGVVPLLQLWSSWEDSAPSRLMALLERLAKDARLSADRRVMVETLLAQGRMRLGDPEAVHARFEELGYVTRFRVIGPFDNEGKAGFDAEQPPEQKRLEAPDLLAQYAGRERPVGWRELPDIVRSGFVSFASLLRPVENVCGFAETFVRSERARPLSLWVGAGGAVKVYWNGEAVLSDSAYRQPSPDRSAVMVGAHAGWNRLLVKSCTTNTAWGFQLRLGDDRGAPAKGLTFATNTSDALNIAAGSEKLRLPTLAPTALAWFAEQEKAPEAKAQLLADYARFLQLTGSDDPSERRAKQLAERAAELDPTSEHLRLAADLAEQRAEVMRFVDRARAALPEDPAVTLMAARLHASGPAPEDALPLLERIDAAGPQGPAAAYLRAGILGELGLPAAALSQLLQLRARIGDTPKLLRTLADAEMTAEHPDASIAALCRLLELRFDDADARSQLVDDALARAETKAVLEHVDAMRAIAPGASRTLLTAARIYDSLGRDDLMLGAYREAKELSPESAPVHVAYARALLRVQQQDAAADALRTALALKPQDAEARELLESLQAVERQDEGYAVSSDDLLARRGHNAGYPYTVLQDTTVKTVFDNGLGSTFRQLAVQVHDEEGARRFRTFSFQYDPDTQHVDLRLSRVYRKDGRTLESVRTYEQQLGEPWYRIYYDTRAVVVIFPDLEPSDVVEVRYRVDDVAHRNLFADYFGDLHLFQDFVPTLQSQYVLVTPVSREIYRNTPALPGLSYTQRIDGKRRIDTYVAKDLPALRSEDDMPGATEVSPYLHVSTYKSWQDVGRWYWGLIKDQLYADAALKRTVAELVKDAKTTREKVERIHDWAVTHTRYVALEFGIHGYLPYRVPLIVQRGFGDCKDKASLMYTMLREAGIDARLTLTRTRRNGAIEVAPASLAVFDHAITYVPELDLYLDGTAEHSGITELPSGDQGVMVLNVGPAGAELKQTPVHSAGKNVRARTLQVQLAADGSARIDGAEEISGVEAAGYREHYQAAGTRSERLTRALGATYPGVEVQSQRFDDLSVLGAPVKYSYKLRVPQFGRWDGNELQLPPATLGDLVRNMARSPTRVHPLELSYENSYVENRTVVLPAGMRAAALPAGGDAVSPFGKLTLRFSQDKGAVHARTEFVVTRSRVQPAEYSEFRRWVESAELLLRQRIALRRGEP